MVGIGNIPQSQTDIPWTEAKNESNYHNMTSLFFCACHFSIPRIYSFVLFFCVHFNFVVFMKFLLHSTHHYMYL